MSPEEVVRAYFDAYSEGQPDRFDQLVSADYTDYGHTPPGRGPQGARDDYQQAAGKAGGTIAYDIDALVARDDDGTVAVVWTGHMPGGAAEFRGLSLYLVAGGQITEVRHTLIGSLPG
jgi:ketosteroid isomerase-like protein